ncbi:DMT family transporter [Micromonospora sp. NBC_01699]|uniref:DMT family transporter n=1 Tax=Micromonospora sp. NBC_01699 TaxID=2975984 RepID=UPI002E281862|nr:DMT family transporter [Micromonospora sp. NBC_01699]
MALLAVLLGLASALFFAFSSALEQHAAKQEKPTRAGDPRLLIRLLHRPLWLFGGIPDVIGTGLQAVALRFGPLALVEPLLMSGLFMAIPLEAALEKRRPHRKDLILAGVGIIGLAAFLVTANPRAGVSQPSTMAWLGVGGVVGGLIAICLLVAWRTRDAHRGTLLGIATGLLYAVAAALLKTISEDLTKHPWTLLAHWHVYALFLVGLAALILNQNAYQSGPIAAPLTAITLLDPFGGIVIGVTAFHETLSTDGPRLVIEIIAVIFMIVGISLASTTRSK